MHIADVVMLLLTAITVFAGLVTLNRHRAHGKRIENLNRGLALAIRRDLKPAPVLPRRSLLRKAS